MNEKELANLFPHTNMTPTRMDEYKNKSNKLTLKVDYDVIRGKKVLGA